MSTAGLFGRAELERAFTALGERLVRRGAVADLFIDRPFVQAGHTPARAEW